MFSGKSKRPAVSHVYAVLEAARFEGLLSSISARATIAPANATATESVAIQPAPRRERRCPSSAMSTAPASGASRQIQPPVVTTSSAELAELVDVEVETVARHRDDEAEPDHDLRGRDGH